MKNAPLWILAALTAFVVYKAMTPSAPAVKPTLPGGQ